MKKIEKQLYSMMEYLEYDKYSVSPTFTIEQIYFCIKNKCLMHFEGNELKKYKPISTEAKELNKWFILNTHANLIIKCQEKAHNKLINKELKRYNLFWCLL